MKNESREVIDELVGPDGRACDLHGRGWTGTVVGEHDSGFTVVLQYVHPDFEQVTEDQIQDFSGEKTCAKCGDPTEPLPVWLSERLIRAYPGLVLSDDYSWEGICKRCAKEHHDRTCTQCGDDIEDEDGWDNQTDYYLQ